MTDPLRRLRSELLAGHPSGEFNSPLPSKPEFPYAVHRFLAAWAHAGTFGADQAVLLRQALRWSKLESILIGPRSAVNADWLRCLEQAGVEWGWDGQLRARPFIPSWLGEPSALDGPPKEKSLDETFAAEAFLQSVGYDRWRSPAQKEAAWYTLQAPPGSTRVIVLPTGSGKSLCFQLLPRFTSGLTVVVVPTIALAIDQQASAVRLFANYPDVNPRYFAADDDAEATLAAVKDKRTRLLYTSPEACVSGRLRPLLNEFAEAGWLANLVVDEAHLIETWGAQFRVEFQILAASRRKWCRASGDQLRTFLFSATMTPACRELLQKLFSDDPEPREFVSQRLRPEIQYYSRQFPSKPGRDAAVIEALWHLPRPLILYVTEKADAERFAAELRSQGFQRMACFHGDTNRHDRRTILRQWKANELDLIIATSAFGVGVDKPDVRTVVHACFPETLDRYYQEVGRGGRDGWSSVSVLLTAPQDRTTADDITVDLLRPETIQKRWAAMFNHANQIEDYCFELPVGARHVHLLGTRTYGENIRWNKRLLLQLERAGLVELLDLKYEPSPAPDAEPEEWIVLKIKNGFAPNTPKLAELIQAQRDDEVSRFRAGLGELDRFLLHNACSGRSIGKLYDMVAHQRRCPGCPYCRAQARLPADCEPLAFPAAAPPPTQKPAEWVEGLPDYSSPASKVLFVDAISRCVMSKRLRHFCCGADHHDPVLGCFAEAFPQNTLELHRLDPLDGFAHLGSAAALPVVFLHFREVDTQAIQMARPFPSVHLYSGRPTGDGRDVAVDERFRRWPSLNAWLLEPPQYSLPCLPTTQ
jgi:ATP-dependent DNA helicase RecQ